MRCVDVNVLVYAHRPESPGHDELRVWLDDARRGTEPLAIPSVVVSGFLRVVTHPKIFKDPTPLPTALAFVDALLASPAVITIAGEDRHWGIFRSLCEAVDATGNAVPDTYLAAMAIEQNAEWFSCDRGFAKYPRLRWRHPVDPAGTSG